MSFIPSPPHGYVPAPHKLVTQASMAAPSVESMFERIMETVQKSVSRCVSAALFSFLFFLAVPASLPLAAATWARVSDERDPSFFLGWSWVCDLWRWI